MFHVVNLAIWVLVMLALVVAELMSLDTPEYILHTSLIIVNLWAAMAVKR